MVCEIDSTVQKISNFVFKIFTPEVVSVWKGDLHIHSTVCILCCCSDAVYVVVVELDLPLMDDWCVCVDISLNGVTDCRRTN